jgi:hypothetical protein
MDPSGDQKVRINGGSTFILRVRLPLTLNLNDVLRSEGGKFTVLYDSYNRRLAWCGSAACDAAVTGITVQGADRCTYVTDKTIYDKSGRVTSQPVEGGQSYTVPIGESLLIANGQRFICGTKFNECSVDQDCAAGHTFTYNGLGAEASAGQLQIYGCVSTGSAPTAADTDFLKGIESEPANTQFNYGNRCQVIRTQGVQCIPGSTSCGSNAVCDVSTFTCRQTSQVQCTQDRDCGAGEVYDQETKSYYKFACVVGACQRQVTRSVECRYNSECPINWFCDADGTCKESTQPKQACPSTCCDGDPRYFDKPAPPGNVCCPGGQSYAPTLDQCSGGPPPPSGVDVPLDLILAALVGLLGFTAKYKSSKAQAAVLGALLGIITWAVLSFFLNNWLLILLGGAVFLYFFGGAILAVLLLILLAWRRS